MVKILSSFTRVRTLSLASNELSHWVLKNEWVPSMIRQQANETKNLIT